MVDGVSVEGVSHCQASPDGEARYMVLIRERKVRVEMPHGCFRWLMRKASRELCGWAVSQRMSRVATPFAHVQCEGRRQEGGELAHLGGVGRAVVGVLGAVADLLEQAPCCRWPPHPGSACPCSPPEHGQECSGRSKHSAKRMPCSLWTLVPAGKHSIPPFSACLAEHGATHFPHLFRRSPAPHLRRLVEWETQADNQACPWLYWHPAVHLDSQATRTSFILPP